MSTTKQRYPLSTFYPLQESVGYLGVLALPSNVVRFTLLAGVVRKVGVYLSLIHISEPTRPY